MRLSKVNHAYPKHPKGHIHRKHKSLESLVKVDSMIAEKSFVVEVLPALRRDENPD